MAREYPRCSLADAGRATGYDGDFAGQPLSWFHVSPVLSSTSQVALGSRDGQRWTDSQVSECAGPCRIARVVNPEEIAYVEFAALSSDRRTSC